MSSDGFVRDSWFELLVIQYLGNELDQLGCEKLDAALQGSLPKRKRFVEICFQSSLFKETLEKRIAEKCSGAWQPDGWTILSDVIELEQEVARLKREKVALAEQVSLDERGLEKGQLQKNKADSNGFGVPKLFFYAAMLMVMVILGLSFYYEKQGTSPRHVLEPTATKNYYIARIESTKDCVWGQDYTKNQRLLVGELHLIKGKAKLIFENNAEVELVGPIKMTLVSSNEFTVAHGQFSAYCPEEAVGFVVNVPRGQIVDRGTWFNVRVEESGATYVDVDAGDVDVSSVDADGCVLQTVHIGVDQSAVLNSDSKGIRAYKEYDVPVVSTGHHMRMGVPDRHWRVTVSNEKRGGFKPGPVYVKRVSGLADPLASLDRSNTAQWVGLSLQDVVRENLATYVYRTDFKLSGYELETVRIDCKFAADDLVTRIRINGVDIAVPKQANYWSKKQLSSLVIQQYLLEGNNRLEFDVRNGEKYEAGQDNYTGLIVFLSGRGMKLVSPRED